MVERVASAASVRDGDVEQTELGFPGRRKRIEADLTAVVVAKGLLNPQQFPGRAAVIPGGPGFTGSPFEKDRVVRIAAAAGPEVRRRIDISTVRPCVELSETPSAGLAELGMEGEALETPFPARRLNSDFPVGIIDIDVLGDGPAVVADTVEGTAHIVDEDAAGAGFIHQPHHACGCSIYVRDRGEFNEVDSDHAVGRRHR